MSSGVDVAYCFGDIEPVAFVDSARSLSVTTHVTYPSL